MDPAWGALHTAGQSLLEIEPPEVVKAPRGAMAAAVVSSTSPNDLRVKNYLAAIKLLAPAERRSTTADRAQLRSSRQASDSSTNGGHADARAYRNVGSSALSEGDKVTVVYDPLNPADNVMSASDLQPAAVDRATSAGMAAALAIGAVLLSGCRPRRRARSRRSSVTAGSPGPSAVTTDD